MGYSHDSDYFCRHFFWSLLYLGGNWILLIRNFLIGYVVKSFQVRQQIFNLQNFCKQLENH